MRRALSSASQSSEIQQRRPVSFASSISSYTWSENLDPLDYEDVLSEQASSAVDSDPMKVLLSFPLDDLQIFLLPRPWRTLQPVIPPEPVDSLDSRVRDCVRCYTAPWLVVQRRDQEYSSGSLTRPQAARLNALTATPRQEFEIDLDVEPAGTCDDDSASVSDRERLSNSSRSSGSTETPRGSWATFDLRQTASDPLPPGLLDRLAPEAIDTVNRMRRAELELDTMFALYPPQEDEDMMERRSLPEMAVEQLGHRILVKCTQLQLDLEIEPSYAMMALYDAKEKKKISENFYFDLSSDSMKHMMDTHIPYQDVSTLSRSCIFNTTFPSTDLFLVVKLEKVLQGDIGECTEPYIKDDKVTKCCHVLVGRSRLLNLVIVCLLQNRDKVRANAVACCERLGRYRMPFAWTGIHLHSIVHGANLDNFRPVTLTVSSFFKQVRPNHLIFKFNFYFNCFLIFIIFMDF